MGVYDILPLIITKARKYESKQTTTPNYQWDI